MLDPNFMNDIIGPTKSGHVLGILEEDIYDKPRTMEVKVKQEQDDWPPTTDSLFIDNEVEEKYQFDDVMIKKEEELILDNFKAEENKDELFCCYHCGFQFNKLRFLRLHIKCQHLKDASSKEALRSHIMSLLNNPNALYEYVNPSHFKNSRKSENYYQCHLCEYRANFRQNLKRHHLARHSSDKPHQCKVCDYATIRGDELKVHVIRHHTNERPYQCNLCDYKTVENRKLKRHIRSVHTKTHKSKNIHQCLLCDYQSVSTNGINRHMKNEHRVVYKNIIMEKSGVKHQCLLCNYISIYKTEVERHMMRKHGKKNYNCSFCEYKTAYPTDLRRHVMSRHTFEKPFKCNLCDYGTAIPSHFKRHARGTKHVRGKQGRRGKRH